MVRVAKPLSDGEKRMHARVYAVPIKRLGKVYGSLRGAVYLALVRRAR